MLNLYFQLTLVIPSELTLVIPNEVTLVIPSELTLVIPSEVEESSTPRRYKFYSYSVSFRRYLLLPKF